MNLEEVDLRGYVSEPDRGRQKWTAKTAAEQAFKRQAQQAVYRNRRRRRGRRSKALHRKRAELVERSFEHVLDDGGLRRVYLRGRENIAKRYLIHTAAFNLGLIMRKLTGFGTPRGWADGRRAAELRVCAFMERSGHRVVTPLRYAGSEMLANVRWLRLPGGRVKTGRYRLTRRNAKPPGRTFTAGGT